MKVISLRRNGSSNDPLGQRSDQVSPGRVPALILLLVVLTGVLTFFCSKYRIFTLPEYRAGDIASSDILVPADVPMQDEEATRLRQQEAKNAALPVYRYAANQAEARINRIGELFSTLRSQLNAPNLTPSAGSAWNLHHLPQEVQTNLGLQLGRLLPEPALEPAARFLVGDGFSQGLQQVLEQALRKVDASYVIESARDLIREKGSIQVLSADSGQRKTIPVDQVKTLDRTRQEVGTWLPKLLQDHQLPLRPVSSLVRELLQPNLSFDLQSTQAAQREAVANVDPVFVILKKGKVVVRYGDEISPGQLRQIEAVRNLPRKPSSLAQMISLAVFIGSLLAVFGYLLRNLWPTHWNFMRLAVLAGTVLVTQTILLKVFGFVGEALSESLSQNFAGLPGNDEVYFFFALPFALGAMLVTILVDDRAALIFSLLSSILAVLTLGSDIYGFFYVLMSNLIGILTIRSAVQRVGFVGAGFKLGSAAIGLFVILQYVKLAPFDFAAGLLGATLALLSGPINTGLLVFLLPLFERFFMVTTIMRLQELGNINLPLIRELILKAPGTYNHSVAVGTLSEGAAEAIGLNPVFARVACFYHDIGKSIHPEYFVENQRGQNIHDRIGPEESVTLVVEHVTEGIRMARAANLPSAMVDIIPQHHGTKLLTYFHEKAKANATTPDEIDESRFRYPGPKPQSKMAAIIMLADAVEAAARTLSDHSQEKLLELIQKIVGTTVEDGQLSECDITLAEIDRIAFSLLETLSSIYHARITYPGFEFGRTQESAS